MSDCLKEIDKIHDKWLDDCKENRSLADAAYNAAVCNLVNQMACSSIPNRFFCLHLAENVEEDDKIWVYQKNKYWQPFAQTLIKRGYAQIQDVTELIFLWFQDLNWPGAAELFDYLAENYNDSIAHALNNAIKRAVAEKDTEWLYWLRLFEGERTVRSPQEGGWGK